MILYPITQEYDAWVCPKQGRPGDPNILLHWLMGVMMINIWIQLYFGTICQTYACGCILLKRLLLLLLKNLVVEPRLFSKACWISETENHIFWQKCSTLSINIALIFGVDTALVHKKLCFFVQNAVSFKQDSDLFNKNRFFYSTPGFIDCWRRERYGWQFSCGMSLSGWYSQMFVPVPAVPACHVFINSHVY